MPLLASGTRNSVTTLLALSNAGVVGTVVHSLPTTPDRWGYTHQSAGGMMSGAVNVMFNFFSANATTLYYRTAASHTIRKNIRVWAECIHSLVR